jgi:hypothetical protein
MSGKNDPTRSFGPLAVAVVVAAFGLLSLVIVNHGPWNRPQIQSPGVVHSPTTGEATQAAGTTVTPTEPKLALEPEAPGPKPVQPASPPVEKQVGTSRDL